MTSATAPGLVTLFLILVGCQPGTAPGEDQTASETGDVVDDASFDGGEPEVDLPGDASRDAATEVDAASDTPRAPEPRVLPAFTPLCPMCAEPSPDQPAEMSLCEWASMHSNVFIGTVDAVVPLRNAASHWVNGGSATDDTWCDSDVQVTEIVVRLVGVEALAGPPMPDAVEITIPSLWYDHWCPSPSTRTEGDDEVAWPEPLGACSTRDPIRAGDPLGFAAYRIGDTNRYTFTDVLFNTGRDVWDGARGVQFQEVNGCSPPACGPTFERGGHGTLRVVRETLATCPPPDPWFERSRASTEASLLRRFTEVDGHRCRSLGP